jgi:hypothetical protein
VVSGFHLVTDKGQIPAYPALRRGVSLLFTLIALHCYTAALGQAIIEPADQQIDLVGVLRIVHAYGAPGYGADTKRDAKISYWALELPSEINMVCTPDRPELAEVQCGPTKKPWLFFRDNEGLRVKARKLIDKRTRVTGLLRRWTSNSQMTPIYIDVIDISRTPATKEKQPQTK